MNDVLFFSHAIKNVIEQIKAISNELLYKALITLHINVIGIYSIETRLKCTTCTPTHILNFHAKTSVYRH